MRPSFGLTHPQLAGTKSALLAENTRVAELQTAIEALEAEVTSAKENLEALRANSATSAEAAEAASIEHEALLKAQSDFSAIQTEMDSLKAAHTRALADATEKIAQLEGQTDSVATLDDRITALQKDKEESANKVSELEVEILELKEAMETGEDEREKTTAELKALRQQLAATKAEMEQALQEAETKQAELLAAAEALKAEHAEALKTLEEAQAAISAELDGVKVELASALEAHESTKTDAATAADFHVKALEEAEQRLVAKEAELLEKLGNITTELEGQEAKYNAKVADVKAEHETLLQQAFERAKDEASEQHREDLNAVRQNFDATTSQMATNHNLTLDDMKRTHQESLEAQKKTFEKQISNLTLDLKATQDDLAKTKTALEAAKSSVASITAQRDEARAASAAAPSASPEATDQLIRLTTELSHTKDDLQTTTEILALTKESLTEMSKKQSQELEDAAKARADEVTKLRAAHDEEITTFAKEKLELQMKLGDLEGEVATLRATLNAAQTAPKSNGNHAMPTSPGVTKEELAKMHEAHTMKIGDLQADHEKGMRALRAELEASRAELAEAKKDLERKGLEIQFMESERDDSDEQVKA